MVQVAMKTSYDVFYYEVPCMLHCLLNSAKQMTEQEYQSNWQKVKDTNQLNFSFAKSQLDGCLANASSVIDTLAELAQINGFSTVNKTDTTCNFGALTVNNLPVLFQATFDNFQDQLNVVYKFAVPPLKDLTTASIKFILTK